MSRILNLFRAGSGIGSAASARSSTRPKDLQRRIFLQTMRSVYPDSIQISYITDPEDDSLLVLRPLSIQDKCQMVSDKVWTILMRKLNYIFSQHVKTRRTVMILTWSLLSVTLVTAGVVGGVTGVMGAVWFQVVYPLVSLFLLLVVPNACFTYWTIRPLLVAFESWKHDLVIQLDKLGIEVIKVTTGEIVSDQSPMRWLGRLYYGSGVWFRFEDAKVEIFWRSVKSGQRVRRYSLMISSELPSSSTDNPDGSSEHSSSGDLRRSPSGQPLNRVTGPQDSLEAFQSSTAGEDVQIAIPPEEAIHEKHPHP